MMIAAGATGGLSASVAAIARAGKPPVAPSECAGRVNKPDIICRKEAE